MTKPSPLDMSITGLRSAVNTGIELGLEPIHTRQSDLQADLEKEMSCRSNFDEKRSGQVRIAALLELGHLK